MECRSKIWRWRKMKNKNKTIACYIFTSFPYPWTSCGIYTLRNGSRSSSKIVKVERNKGLCKLVLDRISRETTYASPNVLVARTSLLTNSFHGTQSFARSSWGYSPLMLGTPSTRVPGSILNALEQTAAARALSRLMRSRDNHLDLTKALRLPWHMVT